MISSASKGVRDAAIRKFALPGSAIIALFLGIAVYLLDRDWGTTLFLAPIAVYQPDNAGVFGWLGNVLPSFFHAYAVSLLLILALGRTRNARWIGALAWFGIAACLEILQADVCRPLVIDLTATSTESLTINFFQSYVVNGYFDPLDLAAAGLGCGLALAIVPVPEVAK